MKRKHVKYFQEVNYAEAEARISKCIHWAILLSEVKTNAGNNQRLFHNWHPRLQLI